MELLDIPPEMLQRVIHCYVNKIGVVEAWRAREVCRTFSVYIRHEVLAKQPISAFLKVKANNGRGILKKNLGEYLVHRVNSLYGAHAFLPQFIQRVVEEVMNLSKKHDENTRKEYTSILCNVLAQQGTHVWSLVTGSRNSTRTSGYDDDKHINQVAAAAAIGNVEVLETLLSEHPEYLVETSVPFGTPIGAATAAGQIKTLKALAKKYKGLPKDLLHPSYQTLWSAISVPLLQNDLPMINFFVDFYSKYLMYWDNSTYLKWMKNAVTSGNVEPVKSVLRLPWRGKSKYFDSVIIDSFELACRLDHEDAALFLLNNYDLALVYHGREVLYPLATAASYGNARIVKALLDGGASPDGDLNFPSHSPLAKAVRSGHTDTVRILLEHGARPVSMDTSSVDTLWFGSEELPDASARKQIHALVANAKQREACRILQD